MDEQLINEFDTRAPDGRTVRLFEYEEIVPAGNMKNPNATIPGLKRLETEDGQSVNFVDDRTFTLVATGETLER